MQARTFPPHLADKAKQSEGAGADVDAATGRAWVLPRVELPSCRWEGAIEEVRPAGNAGENCASPRCGKATSVLVVSDDLASGYVRVADDGDGGGGGEVEGGGS